MARPPRTLKQWFTTSHWGQRLMLGTALFPTDLPHPERIKILKNYFRPAIGDMVTIPHREFVITSKVDPLDVGGFIKVIPPKGQCLTISRHPRIDDTDICRDSFLHFKLRDLNDAGVIRWNVVTGEGDFGTQVRWPTPYRLGRHIPAGAPPNAFPFTTPIIDCKISGRTMTLVLLAKKPKVWRVTLPKKDVLEPQPPKPPNLVRRALERTLAVTGDRPASDTTATPRSGASSQPAEADSGDLADRASKVFARKKSKKALSTTPWRLHPRNTYTMDGANFFSVHTTPTDMGKCRYRYHDAPGDPEAGVVECFKTADFDMVYAPATCLGEMQRPKIKKEK